MALLPRFDTPAYLPDFTDIPGQPEQWHAAMSTWFDAAVQSELPRLAGGRVQFYNPATCDPGEQLLEQAITWNAFPKELLRRFGRERALQEADTPWPLSRYSPAYTGPVLEQMQYRPQTEYCEWHVIRDPDTRSIRRVTFTSEPPEYWQALFGSPIDTGNGQVSSFTGNQDRVLQFYREWISPQVQMEDLIADQDIFLADGSALVRKGQYNCYNRWNTRLGAMHLCAPPNSLIAEIFLGADATVLRRDRRGRALVEPEALICCAGYGGPDRNSDPTIGSTVNALARAGALITLLNPVGLYMDHIDLAGWEAPHGFNVADCVHIVRGTPGMIERLIVEVPATCGFTVGDLTIGGEPIRFGGQIAECITVKLTGIAARLGTIHNTPVSCESRCCMDAANATRLNRPVLYTDPLPPGTQAVFGDEGEADQEEAGETGSRSVPRRSPLWRR